MYTRTSRTMAQEVHNRIGPGIEDDHVNPYLKSFNVLLLIHFQTLYQICKIPLFIVKYITKCAYIFCSVVWKYHLSSLSPFFSYPCWLFTSLLTRHFLGYSLHQYFKKCPLGAPGRLSRLSVWRLILVQVTIPGSWDQAPGWGILILFSVNLSLSLSLSLCPSTTLSLSKKKMSFAFFCVGYCLLDSKLPGWENIL